MNTVNVAKNVREAFSQQLAGALTRGSYTLVNGNIDTLRFPEQVPGAGRKVRLALRQGLFMLGLLKVRPAELPILNANLACLLQEFDGLARLYGRLEDEYSRELLVAVLARRVLGPDHVQLALNSPRYWRTVAQVKQLARHAEVDGQLDLAAIQWPVKLHASPLHVLTTYLLEQYRYAHAPVSIGADEGDVVIDGGACWGDTALYFAHRVGPRGRVVAFEFAPHNLQRLEQNLTLNPELAPRVQVVPAAMWDRAGEPCSFAGNDASSKVEATPSSATTQVALTDTIDAVVARLKLPRVNYIKMDIEGAELRALQGAAETIRRFRPKLAISIYHSWQDFTEIADYLAGLKLGYQFYLDHFTIHTEETILFARVDSDAAAGGGANHAVATGAGVVSWT